MLNWDFETLIYLVEWGMETMLEATLRVLKSVYMLLSVSPNWLAWCKGTQGTFGLCVYSSYLAMLDKH
jgi:hypothetical protein